MSKKSPRYTDEFKMQIVELYNSGKPYKQIVSEYKIARSTLHKWVHDYNNTRSFKAKDNRSEEENEILRLKKELQQLRMENDILKQAALIMARK
jgi:transposase